MQIEVEPIPAEEIRTSRLLQQSTYWARVKESQGWEAYAFDTQISRKGHDSAPEDKQAADTSPTDILVLLHSVGPGASMAYVPYGPRFLPDEERRGIFLESLSENLRPLLPDDCLFIRYDLPWESPWAVDENRYDDRGNWLGPPDPEIREIRMNFDTRYRMIRKAPGNNLPAHTLFLDLEQDPERILAGMKAKTRYNIRLAGRKGIRVEEAGPEELETWQDLYLQTARRNGITLHDPGFFQTSLRAGRKRNGVRLLLARYGQEPVAGMFLGISGDRATYLYGASSNRYRNLMGSYALQWEAIRLAMEEGCREYDLFGVSPEADPSHPLYGLYRFKRGFGGRLFHRQGCWDYPLDEKRYLPYRALEMNSQGYHTR